MLRRWSVIGFMFILLIELTCAIAQEDGPPNESASAKNTEMLADRGIDLFARLRTTQFRASDDYWQQFGLALSRIAKLEGATYDPASGAVLLVGQPAESYGPYDLDDLMVVLKAKLFHLEPLGMTIDPNPADPRGPKQVVRYFAGCEDTACGWVMFECDRLLKCYSQGKDNISGESMDPGLQGFGNMLQRAAASGRAPAPDRWNRFWLDVDIHDHDADEERPTTSNGTQPVACVTPDGSSMELAHCRVYLRTELMKISGGALVTAGGEQNPDAEQFANHFSNEYEHFAGLHPEFAQLEAISHLVALCDWMIEQRIPLDVDYIASYRQRVPVLTPTWTPAVNSEMMIATPVSGGIKQVKYQAFGGVSMSGRVFLARDEGSAQALGNAARKGQAAHRMDAGWLQKNEDGSTQLVAAMPTLNTRFQRADTVSRPRAEFRKQGGDESSPIADLPYRPTFADADRDALVPNTQISFARLKACREQQPRGPPDAVVFGDQRHFAVADRTIDISRAEIPLIAKSENNPNVLPRPPTTEPSGQPPGTSSASTFNAQSDRSESATTRVDISLKPPVAAEPYAPRPPPDEFRGDAERTPLDFRPAVPLTRRSETRQLGLTIFETPSGSKTLNLPKVVSWNNPTHERIASVQGVPGSEIVVADQLALVSELGDIRIAFGDTEIDQDLGRLYYATVPPGQHGVKGYYPQTSTLLLSDGAHIRFNTSGFPQQVKSENGTLVEFQYVSIPSLNKGQSRPVVEKCNVVSASAEAESGEYVLLAEPPLATGNANELLASVRKADVIRDNSLSADSSASITPKPAKPTTESSMADPGLIGGKAAGNSGVDLNSIRFSEIDSDGLPDVAAATEMFVSFPGAASGEIYLDPPIQFECGQTSSWTASLRLSQTAEEMAHNSSWPSDTIYLTDESGQTYEIAMAKNSGTLAAGEVESFPLLLRPAEKQLDATSIGLTTYLTVELRFIAEGESTHSDLSIPLHLVHGDTDESSAFVWVVMLGIGLVAASLAFVYLKEHSKPGSNRNVEVDREILDLMGGGSQSSDTGSRIR